MADQTWEDLKKLGNDAYGKGQLEDAVKHYGASLEKDLPTEDRATVLCNRAQCFLRLGKFDKAVEDCTTCLSLSPKNMKAFYRRASAFASLGKKKEALADYYEVRRMAPKLIDVHKAILRIDPNDKESLEFLGGTRSAPKQKPVQVSEEDMQTIQELDTRIKTLRRQVVQTQERKRRAEAETRQRMLVEKQLGELDDEITTFETVGKMYVKRPMKLMKEKTTESISKSKDTVQTCERALEDLTKRFNAAQESKAEFFKSLRRK